MTSLNSRVAAYAAATALVAAAVPAFNSPASAASGWSEFGPAASITIETRALLGRAGPGTPVDLDILVEDSDGNDLVDEPVDVSVDTGFISPAAETEGDLILADGHAADGDLWGFFQNDGQTQTVSTEASGRAGFVAAIERDPSFDDDGLATMTVTVTAGSVTATEQIAFHADVLLNQGEASLERAAYESPDRTYVGDEVNFQFYVHDQFGNLVGGVSALVSDDSAYADVATDEGEHRTLSDFAGSAPSVHAFAQDWTTQTISAETVPGEQLVDAAGQRESNFRAVTTVAEPIDWSPHGDPAGLVVRGRNNGARDDKITARAITPAAGARVRLFRKTSTGLKLMRTSTMNAKGNRTFENIPDKNGRKYTKYVLKVDATVQTNKLRGARQVR